MAFTDNCDIFASFHEDGFNGIVGYVQQQRPSLFNYATAQLAANPQKLCQVINANPIVALRSNPLVTIVDLLPSPRHGVRCGLRGAGLRGESRLPSR